MTWCFVSLSIGLFITSVIRFRIPVSLVLHTRKMVAKSQPHSLLTQNDNPKTAKNKDNLQIFRSHQLLRQRTKNPPSTINPTKETQKNNNHNPNVGTCCQWAGINRLEETAARWTQGPRPPQRQGRRSWAHTLDEKQITGMRWIHTYRSKARYKLTNTQEKNEKKKEQNAHAHNTQERLNEVCSARGS